MILTHVISGVDQLRASLLTALFFDSTRPMRFFIASSSLLLGIWLLLPGDSISTPTTIVLRQIFGADEWLSICPLFAFAISIVSEMKQSTGLRTFAAFSESVWWTFLGMATLAARFNSLAAVLWLSLGGICLWVVWRTASGRD